MRTRMGEHLVRDILYFYKIFADDDLLPQEIANHLSSVYGVTYGIGCTRTAYLFPSFVIKVSHVDRGKILTYEHAFITQMRNTVYRKHFPETYLIRTGCQYALIQERIPHVGSERSYAHELAITALGKTLDIDDVNGDNFGWKGNTPVFVDVAERFSLKRKHR